jgi:hypothetical protein
MDHDFTTPTPSGIRSNWEITGYARYAIIKKGVLTGVCTENSMRKAKGNLIPITEAHYDLYIDAEDDSKPKTLENLIRDRCLDCGDVRYLKERYQTCKQCVLSHGRFEVTGWSPFGKKEVVNVQDKVQQPG